jgi:prolyl-tRNA synthetase
MMGGKLAHEYMYLTAVGEDTLLLCDACNYGANRQIARFQKAPSPQEEALPLEKVATPETTTIEDLANFLDIPASKTAKAVFMMASIPDGTETVERFVFAVVRGDMEVNETKLTNALKAKALRPATEDEIVVAGAVPGYASPIGLENALVVVDDAIPQSPNLVAGANQEGFHMRNVNYGRDYQAEIVADIVAAQEGDACPECGSPLRTIRGVEVGNIFKLGTRYTDAMGSYFLDKDGQEKPIIMGSYGIGSGRLLACVAEEHHDEYGLIWPISVAPYQVHLIALSGRGDSQTLEEAERLYSDLQEAGFEVLFDDRNESPGVKFNDADLLGMPIRLTVSDRARKQGGVEYKRRDLPEKRIVSGEDLIAHVKAEIQALEEAIQAKVLQMPYDG